MGYPIVGISVLLAAVFATAAGGKSTPGTFAEHVVATGRLLPPWLRRHRRPVAGTILCCEIALALALLCGLVPVVPIATTLTAGGFLLGVLLSGSFGVAIIASIRRGDRQPCRCFGASSTPLGAAHLVRNACLIGLAGVGLAITLLRPESALHPAGVAVAGAGGLVGALILIRLDDLVALFTDPPTGPTGQVTFAESELDRTGR